MPLFTTPRVGALAAAMLTALTANAASPAAPRQEAGGKTLTAIQLDTSRMWGTANADYNNDGHDDVFITGHDDEDRIWYWTPTGYTPSTQRLKDQEPGWIDRHDCDAADVNKDGMLDFYCAIGGQKGLGEGPNQLWIQGPLGTHTKVFDHGAEDKYGRGRFVKFINFNHDGWPDLFVTNEPTIRPDGRKNINRVFANNKDGTFSEVRTIATGMFGGTFLATGDFNGDGWDDVIVCNDRDDRKAHVYINDKAGNFTEVAPPGAGVLLDVRPADFNGDGRLDLAVLTQDDNLQVWLNSGTSPYFTQLALDEKLPHKEPQSITVGDFNKDGLRDIYVAMRADGCAAAEPMQDRGPDWVYTGMATGGWKRVVLKRQAFAGCGFGADTLDGNKVLLLNGGGSFEGPGYVLEVLLP